MTEASGVLKRVLVVTDCSDAAWSARARAEGSHTYRVLVFGHNAGQYLERNHESLAGLDCSALSPESYTAVAQAKLQQFYPAFVSRFPREPMGGRTLLDLLSWREGPNLWWFGETCEKSPLRGPLIHQLYRLALLDSVFQQTQVDEVWLWLRDGGLRACIERGLSQQITVRPFRPKQARAWTRWLKNNRTLLMLLRLVSLRVGLVASVLAARLIVWRAGVERFESKGTKLLGFYSRYPALWRNAHGERPVERYFGHVEQRLAGKARYRFFVWTSDVRGLWCHRRELAALWERASITSLVPYLAFGDLASVLFDRTLVLAYVSYQRRIAPRLVVPFLRWDVAPLWDQELRRSITGLEVQQNMLLFLAVKRLTTRIDLAALVNPLEFQPMERAIWAGAAGRAKRVAVQHSAYCRNHLMYFFEDGELAEHACERAAASPLPDFYVAAGRRPFSELERNGVPADRIGLCGAVRYNDLRLEQRPARDCPQTTQILVLTSQLREESLSLVRIVANAAASLTTGYQFAFRSHYHCVLDDDIEQAFAARAPAAVRGVLDPHASLHDQIRDADVVIVGATTAAIEVLALGHLPLVYFESAELPLCPLLDFGSTYRAFSTADELVREVRSPRGLAEDFLAARAGAIEALFCRLDGNADKRFIEFLDRVTAG